MFSEPAASLENWREQTSFSGCKDRVLASPLVLGKKPYWPDVVLKRHIFSAAKEPGSRSALAGIGFGAHWPRFYNSLGASVKTTQELMRHSLPVMTLGTYAEAVMADKRLAQDAIAALFVGSGDDATTADAS
jgi:integrase